MSKFRSYLATKTAVMLAVLLVLAFGAGAVFAVSSSNEIHACVKNKGQVRIVGTPDECMSQETPLTWNTVGPQGPPGADGADGQDGANGLPGADGQDGEQGLPGADGQDGTDGAQGPPGADGQDGADGADGQDGADGADGQSLSRQGIFASLADFSGSSLLLDEIPGFARFEVTCFSPGVSFNIFNLSGSSTPLHRVLIGEETIAWSVVTIPFNAGTGLFSGVWEISLYNDAGDFAMFHLRTQDWASGNCGVWMNGFAIKAP